MWRIVWFFYGKGLRIKRVFNYWRKIRKYQLFELRGGKWDDFDHQHICLALRLLNTKDFEQVCVHHKFLHKQKDAESSCYCDFCPYMKTIEFNTTKKGRKKIEIL